MKEVTSERQGDDTLETQMKEKDFEIMKKWLIDQFPDMHQVANFTLVQKVKLAWEISDSISKRTSGLCKAIHACDRAEEDQCYNDDILDIGKSEKYQYIVLQSASVTQLSSIPDEISNLEYDECIYILGCKLYELFSGQSSEKKQKQEAIEFIKEASQKLDSLSVLDEMDSSRKRGKLTQKCFSYEEMKNMNLPSSLCSLISTLIEPDNAAYRYESFSEVAHDLYVMTRDPERYLHDPNLEKLRGKLEIPKGRIYGRTREIGCVMDTYHRVFGEKKSEICLVCGYSGTGKSYIVNQLKEVVAKSGGYFLTAKFQQLTNSNPFSALILAFNEYCEQLLERKQDQFESIKANIIKTLGSDSKVLTDLIPKLSEVIEIPNKTPKKLEGPEEVNRRNLLLHTFVNAISALSGPIVLFLDDLQWTDEETLGTVQHLVSGRDVSPIFLIGCYRDNEVGDDHPLITYIHHMEQLQINITKIKIDNIGKDDTNDFLSEILCLSPTMTRPFTNIVYRKTGGNPLFIVEFIKALHKDGLLNFSLRDRRWHWDINSIGSKTVAQNVVELLKLKMMKLPENVQQTLMIASCLGSHTKVSVYNHLTNMVADRNFEFSDSLQVAVDEGLIDRYGHKLSFSHDEIEKAAYALIPDDQRASWHLRLGKTLRQANLEKGEKEKYFCQAIRQMNLGISLVESKSEKSSLAKFNLDAGNLSIAAVSFSAALKFFETGLNLLDDDDWNNANYSLILELTNASIETSYILGVYASLEEMVKCVVTKAVSFEDKLCAYFVGIKALGSSFRVEEALAAGLRVLDQLGESFPSVIDQTTADNEFHLTRVALDGFSEDHLPNLPLLTDEKKITIVKFMVRLFHVCFFHESSFFQVLVFRFIRLSLEYGVCSHSANGFSCYGIVLCIYDDYAGAYRFGKIALKLIERFKATSSLPMVVCHVAGLINYWSEAVELSRQSLLESLDIALKVGDTQCFAANSCHYFILNILGGRKLEPRLSEECDVLLNTMLATKQEYFFAICSTWSRTFPILVGNFHESSNIFAEIERMQGDVLKASTEAPPMVLCHTNSRMLWLNFLFGRFEDADKNRKVLEGLFCFLRGHILEFCYYFFGGLSSMNIARVSQGKKRKEFRNFAKTCIDRVKVWAQHFPWNFQHRLELLNAEWHYLEHDIKSASKKFKSAIKLASERRLVYEKALIYERTALYNKEIDNIAEARDNFDEANKLYREWGSMSKVSHINMQLLLLSAS